MQPPARTSSCRQPRPKSSDGRAKGRKSSARLAGAGVPTWASGALVVLVACGSPPAGPSEGDQAASAPPVAQPNASKRQQQHPQASGSPNPPFTTAAQQLAAPRPTPTPPDAPPTSTVAPAADDAFSSIAPQKILAPRRAQREESQLALQISALEEQVVASVCAGEEAAAGAGLERYWAAAFATIEQTAIDLALRCAAEPSACGRVDQDGNDNTANGSGNDHDLVASYTRLWDIAQTYRLAQVAIEWVDFLREGCGLTLTYAYDAQGHPTAMCFTHQPPPVVTVALATVAPQLREFVHELDQMAAAARCPGPRLTLLSAQLRAAMVQLLAADALTPQDLQASVDPAKKFRTQDLLLETLMTNGS